MGYFHAVRDKQRRVESRYGACRRNLFLPFSFYLPPWQRSKQPCCSAVFFLAAEFSAILCDENQYLRVLMLVLSLFGREKCMQRSSLVLFCDECGFANDPAVLSCAACHHPLAHAKSELNTPPIAPIIVAPPPVLEVRPGPPFTLDKQGTHAIPSQYPPCDFRPGSILAGRYQIQEEIGRGGFSIVYRAVDRKAGPDRRLVAIKRIQLNQLSPREVIDATETFHREVALLPRFSNVVGIPAYYEHLTDAENWYLITEYIEGQTLEEYLQKAPGGYLDEKEVIELGIGIADVLKTLHTSEPSVIFRDLKPTNMIITPNHTLFLIDFGIARTFMPGKTKDTTPLGSPGYAPPEQYGRAQTDQRSDIYSLGATLQTLLTGRDPLELRAGEPSRNPKTPSRRLRKLLDEMLSGEAAQRPADMSQVKKRLALLQAHLIMVGMAGAVFGAVLGIFSLLPSFTLTLFGFLLLKSVMGYMELLVAILVESAFRIKLKLPQKLPKGLRRFWWLGVPVGMFPFVLWHIFFG